MKKRILITILLLFVLACNSSAPKATDKTQCTQDSDCVPATCCHPKDAVNKASAPNCEMVACTQQCVPGTIDCGQGEIKCTQNQCKAILY